MGPRRIRERTRAEKGMEGSKSIWVTGELLGQATRSREKSFKAKKRCRNVDLSEGYAQGLLAPISSRKSAFTNTPTTVAISTRLASTDALTPFESETRPTI